ARARREQAGARLVVAGDPLAAREPAPLLDVELEIGRDPQQLIEADGARGRGSVLPPRVGGREGAPGEQGERHEEPSGNVHRNPGRTERMPAGSRQDSQAWTAAKARNAVKHLCVPPIGTVGPGQRGRRGGTTAHGTGEAVPTAPARSREGSVGHPLPGGIPPALPL